MGRKKKQERGHIVKTEIPMSKYKRWRVDETNSRVIFIDFRCIRNVPFKPVDYGMRRHKKWNSPQQLQELVNAYFASCYGPIFNPKTGMPYLKEDGSLQIGQIKPFTVSGLACYIHIETPAIKKYSRQQIDDMGYPTDEDYMGPQYSDIINEARKKIEAYAEERLYDRDGFGGGKFVLNCAFGWQEKMEEATIKNMQAQQKMKEKELKLKKKMSLGDSSEEPITINIVRAKKPEEEEEG